MSRRHLARCPVDHRSRRREAGEGAGPGLVHTVHRIGRAPSPSVLTAVAAIRRNGARRRGHRGPLGGGSAVLLAPAVMTALTLIVPSRATRDERFL